jgi:hypothetical protein
VLLYTDIKAVSTIYNWCVSCTETEGPGWTQEGEGDATYGGEFWSQWMMYNNQHSSHILQIFRAGMWGASHVRALASNAVKLLIICYWNRNQWLETNLTCWHKMGYCYRDTCRRKWVSWRRKCGRNCSQRDKNTEHVSFPTDNQYAQIYINSSRWCSQTRRLLTQIHITITSLAFQ